MADNQKKLPLPSISWHLKIRSFKKKRKLGKRKKKKPCCSVRRKFSLCLMHFHRTMQACSAVTRAVLMVLEDSPLHLARILSSRSFAWQCWNFSNSIKLEPGISPLTPPQFCLCASNYHFLKGTVKQENICFRMLLYAAVLTRSIV